MKLRLQTFVDVNKYLKSYRSAYVKSYESSYVCQQISKIELLCQQISKIIWK